MVFVVDYVAAERLKMLLIIEPNRLRFSDFSSKSAGDPTPDELTSRVRGYSDGEVECRPQPGKLLDMHPTLGEGGVAGGGTLTGRTDSGGTSLTDGRGCSVTGSGMLGVALLLKGLDNRFVVKGFAKEAALPSDFACWSTSADSVSLLVPRRCSLLAVSTATAVFTAAGEETDLVVRNVEAVGDEGKESSSVRLPLAPADARPSRRAIQVPVTTMSSLS